MYRIVVADYRSFKFFVPNLRMFYFELDLSKNHFDPFRV